MAINRSGIPDLLLGGERKSRGGTTGRKIALGINSAVGSKKSRGDSLSTGVTLAEKRARSSDALSRGAALAVRRKKGGLIDKGYVDKDGYRVDDADGAIGRKRMYDTADRLSGLRLSNGGSAAEKKKGGRLWIQDAINPNNKGK